MSSISLKKRKLNVDPIGFIRFQSPYHVYLLGLLWADGIVYRYIAKKYDRIRIAVDMNSEDLNELKTIFDKTGKWNEYINTKRNTTLLYTQGKEFYNFLIQNNYKNKSGSSPDQIIKLIPDSLQRYFFLGHFDGDGCIHVSRKKHKQKNSIIFTSTKNQDWNFITNLLDLMNVKYTIKRRIDYSSGNAHESSSISIHNRFSVQKIFNYLYPHGYEFGLKRKYEKFLQIPLMQNLL